MIAEQSILAASEISQPDIRCILCLKIFRITTEGESMKRTMAILAICAYLGSLSWGIVAHTIGVGVGSHPGMYYVVWDMFCGWGAYSTRWHVIGEGESGRYYEVAPAPWGELQPFGNVDRRHYDDQNYMTPALIRNNLARTSHEPISRVFVVEEAWPKKFNLPDHLWAERYDEPKDQKSYYHLRAICDNNGNVMEAYPNWHSVLYTRALGDNPRIAQQRAHSRPFYSVSLRSLGLVNPAQSRETTGSRMGN